MTLALAMILDAVLGEPRWLWSRLPHPAVLMGRTVSALDARLNNRTVLAGALALGLLVLGAGLLGLLLSLGGPVVEVLVAAILLAQRSLVTHVRAVADGLRLSLTSGRQAAAMIVSRDLRTADGPAVARAAIESAAENLSDGVIAPAFWFAVAGLPGLIIYKAVSTADSMIGYRTERFEAFGKAAARADDVLNYIPARATAVLIAAIGRVTDAQGIIHDAGLHRSPNAGWPEAAMARALGVALSGPRVYDGILHDLAWVNPAGTKGIGPVQIDAAAAMLWKAWAAALGLALFIALI